jgi:hypothetical protein
VTRRQKNESRHVLKTFNIEGVACDVIPLCYMYCEIITFFVGYDLGKPLVRLPIGGVARDVIPLECT